MSDDEPRWTGFEVGNGDYIVCDPDNAHAWIRSDTVMTVGERADSHPDSSTRQQ